jgi:hypothetical protein
VVAQDAIVAACQGGFTAQQLSSYLQQLAEQGGELHGKLHKHITKGTVAY